MYPTNRRYSKDHEWILLQDGIGTVGITDYAQDQLGDIVYVELPEKGKEVRAGDVLGTIESVKAVSEIYAPVAGVVEEVNSTLDAEPEKVNRDPHDQGWYCKLRVLESRELEGLMEAEEYQAFIETSD